MKLDDVLTFFDVQHPNLPLILLGISIGAAAVLDVTGVFTNCWIRIGKNCTGIVPFDSTEPAWLAVSSWMLFISVGVMVIMIATYIVVIIEIRRRGYHITVRKWLLLIGILFVLNVLLIINPIVVIPCALSNYTNEKLGWSYWLTGIAIGALFLVEFFRIRVKRQCTAT
ncbi:hypothetical protein GCK72_016016 [Caenorhabditis remanei]|uniref:Uncharacterized protein n=1 Tax=Caenorhabditis remanei TaxID=31234 RepID=A0A6A5GY03_CAERE|nr:hypothetical protein GCK72_016016 [Caenorhabditis remanei]KAF1759549.1 hypothetical protein GCK72_016016 [Caenorhabditis remanei]